MTPFHVALHALPAEVLAGPNWNIDGRAFRTLHGPDIGRSEPFEASFEWAVDQLNTLPRMFVEPDGSFVWVGDAATWQLDGSLYDRNGRLLYVELKGSCSGPAFSQLRRALGAPPGGMMIQLLRQAVFLSETEFEKLAFSGEPQ